MPTGTDTYAFNTDFSRIAVCLFAIQAVDDSGGFADDAEARQLLAALSDGALKKLYNRTLALLGQLEGAEITPGQLDGDFDFLDYNFTDFSVGLIDERNNGYSSRFQTILNIFTVFSERADEISPADNQALTAALVDFLDAFEELQAYLTAAGLSPCVPQNAYFNNSRNLILQAAGTDGSDGLPAGIHLRWGLAGELGENHLPRGDYRPAGTPLNGFNRLGDFVTVSRTPYVNPVNLVLDFETALPAINYNALRWTYLLNMPVGDQHFNATVRLTFLNGELYRQAAQATDPGSNPFGFLKSYAGGVEISLSGKNFFCVRYDWRRKMATGSASLKLEAQRAGGIRARKTVTVSSAPPLTGLLLGEDLDLLRLQIGEGGYLQSLSFETYDDFLRSREAADWTPVGSGFALSVTQGTVFNRLETAGQPVDGLWPQYNQGTTVNTANYKTKWQTALPGEPSVSSVVQAYLDKSITDPKAMGTISGTDPDSGEMAISYLDVLNLTALDYHWARMLGLGHIDTQVAAAGLEKFIYKISYRNRETSASAELFTFDYLSLPTGLADRRFPSAPDAPEISYGLPAGTADFANIIDADGYAQLEAVRVINVARKPFLYELKSGNFFAGPGTALDFDLAEHPEAVLFGIKYGAPGQPYLKPEITADTISPELAHTYLAHDSDHPGGIPETVLVNERAESLFVHFEKSAGSHVYALYGVNWFSRPSAIGDAAQTDNTNFPLRNDLAEPATPTVQYIQQEDPLVLTTQAEQDWLAQRKALFPGADVNFTRVTFNWLDRLKYAAGVPYDAVRADRVTAYFKPDAIRQVRGLISGIVPLAGPDQLCEVYTSGYQLIDNTTVTPLISNADLGRFTGSQLLTPEGPFTITAVTAGTAGPVFTVRQQEEADVVAMPGEADVFGTRKSYRLPQAGSRFTTTENLASTANWQPVAAQVELISLLQEPLPSVPPVEYESGEGSQTAYLYGGIYQPAVVSLAYDADLNLMPGYYKITFPGTVLAPHPQSVVPADPMNTPGSLHAPYVEWYNGLIRLPLAAKPAEKKLLNVIRIDTADPVVVYVYDGGYDTDPVLVSANPADLVAGVNFHPGYRAYLLPEPAPAQAFHRENILPAGGADERKTLLAIQTADTRPGGSGFASALTQPLVLLARDLQEPIVLDKPLILSLRIRPDATNRAALTFDIKIAPGGAPPDHKPFGYMFYRTSDEDILEALYLDSTVETIRAELALLVDDVHYDQRFLELANLAYDPAHPGQFNYYEAANGGFSFPVPDRVGLTGTVVEKTAQYRAAIQSTLLPLTAQQPIYDFIRTGTQTENQLPVIKTVDGRMLSPADPEFYPFPMIRKYPATPEYIRFTDYTLNGASRFLYFYTAAETTKQLAIGAYGPFAGPVSIIHTQPAEAPVIKSFQLAPPEVLTAAPLVVNFYLTPFAAEDPITGVRIYRSFDPLRTLSLATMDSDLDVEISNDPLNGLLVADTFDDLTVFPAGEKIYYRLAFIRTIRNERDEQEAIIGQGSATETVTLIDTINPEAPQLVYEAEQLSWLPTVNKGTYTLYQQNSWGNWQQLASIGPPESGAEMSYTPDPTPDTTPGPDRIYYRYKVKVENSSGLFNLEDNELTI
jgi:hypothetical protein